MSRRAHVYHDGAHGTHEVGVAYFHETRGSVTTTFHYADSYLARRDSYPIDPSLMLSTGPQPVSGLPGAFQDCSPDRWGRNLITKHHRQEARADDVAPRTLTDVDYLLGVSDEPRQGALRFAEAAGGPFLAQHARVPKVMSLPRLQAAADRAVTDGDEHAAVKELLSAGSGSLGGARPKASIRADDGRLLIAKFSRASDDWSVTAWETTALDLAQQAGLDTPRRRLVTVGGRSVLLLERFDRAGTGRIGYISAMTATGFSDGDQADYLDIAEAMDTLSADFERDSVELFRRAAFSVVIHNTDDHLRNHGLLRSSSGWRLSPVFDVNPHPDLSRVRATSIVGETSGDEGAAALADLADYLSIGTERAQRIASEVLRGTEYWVDIARSNGTPEREVRVFAEVFDHQRAALTRMIGHRETSRSNRRTRTAGTQGRHPSGTQRGGQFTAKQSPPSEVTLGDG